MICTSITYSQPICFNCNHSKQRAMMTSSQNYTTRKKWARGFASFRPVPILQPPLHWSKRQLVAVSRPRKVLTCEGKVKPNNMRETSRIRTHAWLLRSSSLLLSASSCRNMGAEIASQRHLTIRNHNLNFSFWVSRAHSHPLWGYNPRIPYIKL